MAKKNQEKRPGYGKLLDAWVAPEDAGDPVGCLATSFTFSPPFFEEECLARFLQLESDPAEDGPVYLIEREEKLAQLSCAAALVDKHHCRGSRSLRWDLLPARIPHGLLHAKLSLLYWSKLVRLIVASANLTEDGYRRNQEVFGVLDFQAGGEAPLSCLIDLIAFLRRAAEYSRTASNQESPALSRWNALLDRVTKEASQWGLSDEELRRSGMQVRAVFSGPGYPNVFERLKSIWPGGSPPRAGSVLSPFFDRPEVDNRPAHELWALLRRRGEAAVKYYVEAEQIPGHESLLLLAPESLKTAEPQGRPGVSTDFYRVQLLDGRPLHAKGVWLEDERWSMYLIGSSNFTSAGMGLPKGPNLEANLAYTVDSHREPKARRLLTDSFPAGEPVDLEKVQWKPRPEEDEDALAEEVPLPPQFGDATYCCDEKQRATVSLSIHGTPFAGWTLTADSGEWSFGEAEWNELGKPESFALTWEQPRPPSGFWVRWSGSIGSAWWPVNALAGDVLPPPDELKNLPLEVLMDILSSARPIHRVLGDYFRRKKRSTSTGECVSVVDPHKRVDTSQFLLQRTRRISWALNALRERVQKPAATVEALRWRLRGPVGVLALAEALVREAKSEEERGFLLAELALELGRAKPDSSKEGVPQEQHLQEIRQVIGELRARIPDDMSQAPDNLRQYIQTVFDNVLA